MATLSSMPPEILLTIADLLPVHAVVLLQRAGRRLHAAISRAYLSRRAPKIHQLPAAVLHRILAHLSPGRLALVASSRSLYARLLNRGVYAHALATRGAAALTHTVRGLVRAANAPALRRLVAHGLSLPALERGGARILFWALFWRAADAAGGGARYRDVFRLLREQRVTDVDWGRVLAREGEAAAGEAAAGVVSGEADMGVCGRMPGRRPAGCAQASLVCGGFFAKLSRFMKAR